MKLMKYETPSMETVSLENENIICASGEDFTLNSNDNMGYVDAGSLE